MRKKEKNAAGIKAGVFVTRLLLFSALCFSLIFITAATRHEYHVSVTQMQYNPAEKAFETSIRIFTDDLERGLAVSNANKRFMVRNNDQNDAYVQRYIDQKFLLTDASGKKAAARYLGKEQEEDATWIYLEIPFQPIVAGCKLQNSILSEVFDDQVNMTNLKLPSEKKTFLFKKGQLTQRL